MEKIYGHEILSSWPTLLYIQAILVNYFIHTFFNIISSLWNFYGFPFLDAIFWLFSFLSAFFCFLFSEFLWDFTIFLFCRVSYWTLSFLFTIFGCFTVCTCGTGWLRLTFGCFMAVKWKCMKYTSMNAMFAMRDMKHRE